MKNMIDTWVEATFNATPTEIGLALFALFLTIIWALDATGTLYLVDVVAGLASWI